MEILEVILIFLFGADVGALIVGSIMFYRLKKFKNAAELYLGMYTEAAEIIKDLVVYDDLEDDLR